MPFVDRGWIPHDEGVLGQSAERVLNGELPQRDFDDLYTGGLSVLHAFAFRLLGVRLHSLRLVLLAGFLAFVPALYAVASRFAPPLTAGALTLLGIAWSVPNYFASMPSWYNLFLATFSTLALMRHIETDRRLWIFLAGLFAGLSVLMKLQGVFLVAAGLLFLVYREEASLEEGERSERSAGFLLFKGSALLVFTVLLWRLISIRPGHMEYLHFFVPGAALCAFLVWSEHREGRGEFSVRWKRLVRLLGPYLAGVAASIVFFLAPYAIGGGLPEFVRGVLTSSNRLTIPRMGAWLPPLGGLKSGLLYGGLLLLPASFWRAGRRVGAAIGAILVCAALLIFSRNDSVLGEVFWSARSLGVLVVLGACLALARATVASALSAPQRQAVFLVSAAAAMTTIVQFPYAAPIYFCFAAPLVALAVLAVAQSDPRSPRALHLTVLLFYLIFAVLRTNVGYAFNFGSRFERYRADAVLDPVRAGLRVPAADRAVYESLVALVREKSGSGRVFAGPDSPEVPFLSNRANPTRSLVNFLDAPRSNPEVVGRLLREMDIRVVVINRQPPVSRSVRNDLIAVVSSAFPESREIGRFTVYWRD